MQEEDLWEDLLPVVACLSPEVQARVVNLEAIRQPSMMRRILKAADATNAWPDLISLVQWMGPVGREAVSEAVAAMPEDTLRRVAYAALLREQWEPTLDVVRRLPLARQQECLRIVEHYRVHADVETMARIDRRLRHHGLVVETA